MSTRGKKADIVARLESVERDRTLLSYALSAKMNGDKATIVERWRNGDDRYRVELYHPSAPHGGFVIVVFMYPGQKNSHAVYYADEWCRDAIAHGIAVGNSAMATAAENVRIAARAAYYDLSATGPMVSP